MLYEDDFLSIPVSSPKGKKKNEVTYISGIRTVGRWHTGEMSLRDHSYNIL